MTSAPATTPAVRLAFLVLIPCLAEALLPPVAAQAQPAPAPAAQEAAQGELERLAVEIIAPLIDPEKLDTLRGDRPANRRLRLIGYHLESGRRDGLDPAAVIDRAQDHLGVRGTARAEAVKESLLRNLTILERLGCLDAEGMAKLRKGNARPSHAAPTPATSPASTTSFPARSSRSSTPSSSTWSSCLRSSMAGRAMRSA